MKRVILMLLLLLTCAVFSQKMVTRSGEIKFDATVPGALEEVIGTNKTVSGVFDKATGDIVVQAMVKSFKFKAPLMEEHFNENYMESDKLPKATFKGKIIGYNGKPGTFDVEGDLTIHGVSNPIKTKITLIGEGDKLVLSGTFVVKLADYKIDVPALAKETLATTAKIVMKLPFETKS